jgi:septal ring factor EnvC (AmiA/AmiB activator)
LAFIPVLLFFIHAYTYKGVNAKCGGMAMYLGVFDMKERLEQMRKLLKEKRRLKELLEQDIAGIERDIEMLEKQLDTAERSLSV